MHTPMRSARRPVLVSLCLAAVVSVLTSGPAAMALTATPTRTPVSQPVGPFDIRGQVAADTACSVGAPGVVVRLDPSGRTATTDAEGMFEFLDVPGGVVTLTVETNCAPVPCYEPLEVPLFRDESVSLCYRPCTRPTLIPSVVEPGGVVDFSGRCQPSEIGSELQIRVAGMVVASPVVAADGGYSGSFAVPSFLRGVIAGVSILNGEDLVAVGEFEIAQAVVACVGDCNGDRRVSIDELLRGVATALGHASLDTCVAMDASGNGAVTIAELISAVDRALEGCRAPDLVPVAAAFSRCVERECASETEPTHLMEVCVVNQGDAPSGGFSVQQAGQVASVFMSSLPPGGEACAELPFASEVHVEVDPFLAVPELDEDNNVLETTLPFPTCDVVAPPCTPTPPPTATPT